LNQLRRGLGINGIHSEDQNEEKRGKISGEPKESAQGSET